jgi:prepilin-type processing-associated H-X9-DG protein
MSLGYVQSNDGTSKTIMLSESVQVYYWCYDIITAGNQFVQEEAAKSPILDTKHLFGFVWKNPTASQPSEIERINGDRYYDKNPSPESGDAIFPLKEWSGVTPAPGSPGYESYGFPSSNHPGSVNMAFCGGQIISVSETIDPLVYAQLMTPNRNRSSLVDGRQATPVPERKLAPPPDDLY